MDKLKMHSNNITGQNIDKIAELFPNCITESKDKNGKLTKAIDFDLLKQELSTTIVEGQQERYQLNWPGKRESLLTANAPIAKTLRPCRQESVNFDTTENLFIEGDNLDALKLLQETYLGKVKMIYIDPPYNTGKDFIYPDNFTKNTEEYLQESNQVDVEGNRLKAHSESEGRFHSKWLSMMYSRLKLARNLLKDDGVIFISIDDGEGFNLKKICDEIFGYSNFIANAIWRSKDNSNNDAKKFSLDHNNTLVYSKQADWEPNKINDNDKRSHFKNPDNNPEGAYFDGNPLNSPNYRENLIYDLVSPSGNLISPPKNGWRWSKVSMNERIQSGEIRFVNNNTAIKRRTYLKDMKGLPPSTLWIDLDKTGHNRQAKYELLKLIPEDVFDTPKPVNLLKYILDLVPTDKSDIVLDFFSGSATTAHAVIGANSKDGGNRKFIMVQLPEECDEKSEAYNAGYKNIAEISKERIRRAGKQVIEGECNVSWNKDIGFRVLKVDTSNMEDVYYNPDNISQGELLGLSENIKSGRSEEDLLFQVLLDWGVDLTLPITFEEIDGQKVYFVDDNALCACFNNSGSVSESFVKELAKREPLRVVFRDGGFKSDDIKINVGQIFKQMSPHTEVKTI